MEKTKVKLLQIENLRLWGRNPRYTHDAKITINNIGMDDFEITEEDDIPEINIDKYEKNYVINVRKLLLNLDSIKLTLDLIESMSQGFNSSLDEILVVKPKNLFYSMSNSPNFKYIQNLYYVVEGNRRLFTIDLLLNKNGSRKIVRDLIDEKNSNLTIQIQESKLLKEMLKICSEFEDKPTIWKNIECRELDFEYFCSAEGVVELNKILNARHFGNRKGKLNWPRGLILRKIFKLTKNEIKNNPNIEKKDLYKRIENLIGKKINSNDINSALFVYKSLEEWNKVEENEKISWENTETGDVDESFDIQIFDYEGKVIANTEESVQIKISSLELARNNIKLYDQKFNLKSLSEIIVFDYDVSKILEGDYFKMKFKNNGIFLNEELVNKILVEIVRSVKEKEITTRTNEIKPIGIKIRDLIFPCEIVKKEEILNFSIKQAINFGMSKSIDDDTKEMVSNLDIFLKKYETSLKEFDENKLDNILNKVLYYIWKIEYGRIFKLKETERLIDLPIIIFSCLFRTTCEFIYGFIYYNLILDYLKNNKTLNINRNNFYDTACKEAWDKQEQKLIRIFLKNNSIDIIQEYNTSSQKNEIERDLEKIFLYLMGNIINIDSFESSIFTVNFDYNKLKYYIYGTKFNGTNLMSDINLFNLKNNFLELNKELINNSFFGYLNNPKKIQNIFAFLDKISFGEFDTDNKNFNIINRLIHKPLLSIEVFENLDNTLNLIAHSIQLLNEIEIIIISLIED